MGFYHMDGKELSQRPDNDYSPDELDSNCLAYFALGD